MTSEVGPAHCKKFTVTLKLGDEEYSAEGTKIKKAQHLAAKEAIEKTAYPHPIPKALKRQEGGQFINGVTSRRSNNVTPTVELNAVAMKLGQQIYYALESESLTNTSDCGINASIAPYILANPVCIQQSLLTHNQCIYPKSTSLNYMDSLSSTVMMTTATTTPQNEGGEEIIHSTRLRSIPGTGYVQLSKSCKVSLFVDKQKFIGVGKTEQKAKHDAAAQALKVLRPKLYEQQKLLEDKNKKAMPANEENISCEQGQRSSSSEDQDGNEESDHKSPISLVFEFGLRHNLPVNFQIVRENGPAHMRKFITACFVGSIVAEGEGTGKKLSKRRAAEKMWEQLQKIPMPDSTTTTIRTQRANKSLNRNSERQRTTGGRLRSRGKTYHLSRRQARYDHMSEPLKKLLAWHEKQYPGKIIEFCFLDKDNDSNKENCPVDGDDLNKNLVIVEVKCADGKIAKGTGNNKKTAKINAAKSKCTILISAFY